MDNIEDSTIKERIKEIYNEKEKKEGFSTYFTPNEHDAKDSKLKMPNVFDSIAKKIEAKSLSTTSGNNSTGTGTGQPGDGKKEKEKNPNFMESETGIRFKQYFKQVSIFEKMADFNFSALFSYDKNKDFADQELLKSWQTLFEFLLYFIPTLIAMGVYEIVNLFPVTPETTEYKHRHSHDHDRESHIHDHEHTNTDWNKFYKNRASDKKVIIGSAYEYLYIFVAVYIAYVLIYKFNNEDGLVPIEKFLTFDENFVDSILRIVFMYLTALPTLFRLVLIGIKHGLEYTSISEYPTLNFFSLYLVAYLFCFLFLNKMGKMFLDIFNWESDDLVIMFIGIGVLLSFAQFFGELISNPNLNKFLLALLFAIGGIVFIIIFIVHITLSISLAPLAQGIFIIYVLFTMVSGPSDIVGYISSFFGGSSKLYQFATEYINKSKNHDKSDNSFFGNLDYYANIFIYDYFFIFIQCVFFLSKSISFFQELKVASIRNVFGSINIYLFLLLFVIFVSSLLYNVPEFWELFKEKNDSEINPHSEVNV